MSREVIARPGRLRRIVTWLAWVLVIGAVLLGLVIWFAFPWHRVNDLRVSSARVQTMRLSDRGGRPTHQGIVVRFSTSEDLVKLRSEIDIGYITARLFACTAPGQDNREVITQRAEYMYDRGRVTRIGTINRGNEQRFAYQVVFDNELTSFVDHQPRVRSALGTTGGLCFALDGASMWAGKLWSNRVPITPVVS